MRIPSVFRLIPREEGFFDLFEQGARNAHEGALALADLFNDFNNIDAKARRIEDIEHAGDKITHDTITKLNKTFITPFDREDIHRLIGRLDDIIDLMDTGISRMMLYKIAKPTDDARGLAKVLVDSTRILVDLLPLLRNEKNMPDILRMCIEVNTLENEGDRIQRHALASLFDSGLDAAGMIKWKDIYEILESATDRCEDVANIVESIAIKNA